MIFSQFWKQGQQVRNRKRKSRFQKGLDIYFQAQKHYQPKNRDGWADLTWWGWPRRLVHYDRKMWKLIFVSSDCRSSNFWRIFGTWRRRRRRDVFGRRLRFGNRFHLPANFVFSPETQKKINGKSMSPVRKNLIMGPS